MSLACCFTDEKTPYCENRRHERSPMCLRHTHEAIRRAIWDGSVPREVYADLVQYTDYAAKVHYMNQQYEMSKRLVAYHAEQHEQTRHNQPSRESVVYYVRLTGDRIKIGWTANLETRLKSYRSQPTDLLATEPGGRPLEAKRHKQFAHLRIGRSEDFTESPDLLAHIDALKAEAA